jgi:hypothetical protein
MRFMNNNQSFLRDEGKGARGAVEGREERKKGRSKKKKRSKRRCGKR